MPLRPRLVQRFLSLAAVLVGLATIVGTADEAAAQAAPDRVITGQPMGQPFLPDTAVLATVGPRRITAFDFRRGWLNAYPQDLPPADSSGRVEFLNNLVTRDLFALEVERQGRQMTFSDRLEMRSYRQRMLSSLLYRRMVVDSVPPVTDEEITREYEKFRYDVLARHILFADLDLARKVRADLVARRIGWEDAVRRYSRDDSTIATGGSLGWMQFGNVAPVVAIDIWPLEVGVISPVFLDDDGYHVAQVLQRRPATPPDFNASRGIVRTNLERYRTARRLEALQALVRERIHLVYDLDNLTWAARQFRATTEISRGAHGTELTLNEALPTFGPEDTSRVLARYDGGVLSLGRFVDEYSHISVMARPEVNSPGLLAKAVDIFVLEPGLAEDAAARGLEADPLAVRNTALKREGLLVDQLYADSVAAHNWMSPKERRAFYEKHRTAYFTYPSVRFAAMSFYSRSEADSVARLLRTGTDVRAILADSVRLGLIGGSIRTRRQNEGGPYHKLLFEELRPGKVAVDGPSRDGGWFVIQSLDYDAGRQLSYEEASTYVDNDTQKIRAEELLAGFVARLKKRYPVTAHPEFVMRIDLRESD
jgi:hypothetical protein